MHPYLLERRSLKRILFLLDARHGFKKTDFDFLGDLQDGLMTKVDDKKVCIVCVCSDMNDHFELPKIIFYFPVMSRQRENYRPFR